MASSGMTPAQSEAGQAPAVEVAAGRSMSDAAPPIINAAAVDGWAPARPANAGAAWPVNTAVAPPIDATEAGDAAATAGVANAAADALPTAVAPTPPHHTTAFDFSWSRPPPLPHHLPETRPWHRPPTAP